MGLAQGAAAPASLPESYAALGTTLFYVGEYVPALTHIEQGFPRTDLTAQQALGLRHGEAPGSAMPGRGGLDPVVPQLAKRRPCSGGRKRWPRPRRSPIL